MPVRTLRPPDFSARRAAVGGFAAARPIGFLDKDNVVACAKSGNPAVFASPLDMVLAKKWFDHSMKQH